MSIERLDEEVILPLNEPAVLSGNPQELAGYLRALVNELQQIRIYDIHQRVNLLLDLQDGSLVHLGTKNASGDYATGTWRINGESSSQYLIQQQTETGWVTRFTIATNGDVTISGNLSVNEITVSSIGMTIEEQFLLNHQMAVTV